MKNTLTFRFVRRQTVLTLLALAACTTTFAATKLETIYVDLNKAKPYDFSAITDGTFSLIPLESNDECLIAHIDKLMFGDNRIYVLDAVSKSILIFDKKGQFIRKIHQVGNGPGEYIGLIDMTLMDNTIIILDHLSEKKIVYDTNGTFLHEHRVFDKIWAHGLFPLGNKLVYVNQWSHTEVGDYRLFYLNTLNNNITADLPFTKEPVGLGVSGPYYATYADKACVMFDNCDTLFSVSAKRKAVPQYLVKYDRIKVKYSNDVTKVMKENSEKKVLGVQAIHESRRYLFQNISTLGKDYNVIYDKTTKRSLTVEKLMHHGLFGGAPSTVQCVCDNQLIHWYDAPIQIDQYQTIYQKNSYKSAAYKQALDAVMRHHSEESNPILFLYGLKK